MIKKCFNQIQHSNYVSVGIAGRGAGKKYKHSFIAAIPKSAPLGSRERAGAAPCLTDCLL